MDNIHFLISENGKDGSVLTKSNLASTRLRILPCINSLSNYDIKVDFGECISHQSGIVVVGKIGAHNINTRCNVWLNEIMTAKSRGSTIFLDYTDHHLEFEGPMTQFYKTVIDHTDHCIVPSAIMGRLLSKFYDGPVSIIEDVIEIAPQSVKMNLASVTPTALWFGHASNINFLIDFINSSGFLMSGCNLIVLSNEQGLNFFSQSSLKFINYQQIRLGVWSVENMINAAKTSDFSIIPSDLSNPRKLGVSSNRLITSFALGLPTAADHLPSYLEFSDCYVDLRGPSFSNLVDNPVSFSSLVNQAQSLYLNQFKPESIGQKWRTLLLGCQ